MILAFAIGACGSTWAESTTYDSLGRVISVITDDGKQTNYAYDKAGNRTVVATGYPFRFGANQSASSQVLPPHHRPR